MVLSDVKMNSEIIEFLWRVQVRTLLLNDRTVQATVKGRKKFVG